MRLRILRRWHGLSGEGGVVVFVDLGLLWGVEEREGGGFGGLVRMQREEVLS